MTSRLDDLCEKAAKLAALHGEDRTRRPNVVLVYGADGWRAGLGNASAVERRISRDETPAEQSPEMAVSVLIVGLAKSVHGPMEEARERVRELEKLARDVEGIIGKETP